MSVNRIQFCEAPLGGYLDALIWLVASLAKNDAR
jgi:hypothetical protein